MKMIILMIWAMLGQNHSPVQKAPGSVPELFAQGSLQADQNWFWHGSPSFSRDGNEFYFVKYIKGKNVTEIWRTKKERGSWGPGEKVPFSKSEYRDNNPIFLDPDALLFYSARFGGSLCRLDGIADPGSKPVALALPIPAGKVLGKQFSVTKEGRIYIELWNSDDSDADLYYCPPEKGTYPVCNKLSGEVNGPAFDFNPCIDPEEKFIVFSSQRPGGFGKTDLYISFRNDDGAWTRAVNMGPLFNTAEEESFPAITPDGKHFYFCREGAFGFNPYWVDIKAIEALRVKEKSIP